ncbi:MAG: hypothetical protein A7315_01665 [Candidatus Altiarchaeales archaeon WOR_SM1_79]|nr:MAG: hypothetical protein A7315_01665 [Candidatus Altiarchaeales archaeon WOR_SM1_79]
MRTGTAHLPLHHGRAPAWLFHRMKELAREISLVIIDQFGPLEILRRLSDPFWFQSFGCVLGFDWHSSGLTTTLCGALKEGLRGTERDSGLFIAGGKGKVSRRTPIEIEEFCDRFSTEAKGLVYASKMTAKVDSAALQDGYQLYHHTFFFTKAGSWSVVQQGMNEHTGYARRYHWMGHGLDSFVCEPHSAVCCDHRGEVLNMVARESEEVRQTTTLIASEHPGRISSEIQTLRNLELPRGHGVILGSRGARWLMRVLESTHEHQPADFEALLATRGVGAKTIRALALISELIYGVDPSFRDPVKFSFAHGGKDGHPYPVDRENYDLSIEVLRQALLAAKIGRGEKLKAMERLAFLESRETESKE